MKTALATAFVLAASTQARADQCQGNDLNVAKAAEQLLRGATIVEFCEMCGDSPEMGPPTKVTSLAMTHFMLNDRPYYELTINHEATSLDLAYTYVLQHDRYINLGMLTGCGGRGISATLTIAHLDGNRVVITPTHDELTDLEDETTPAPAPAPPPPPAPAPIAVAAPPPQPPTTVVLHEAPEYFDIWATSALAALACGAAAGATIGLVAMSRRRRIMKPRAAQLIARH